MSQRKPKNIVTFRPIEESLMRMVMVSKTMFIRLKMSSIDSERWFSVQRLKICITLEMVNFQDIIELMIIQFPLKALLCHLSFKLNKMLELRTSMTENIFNLMSIKKASPIWSLKFKVQRISMN